MSNPTSIREAITKYFSERNPQDKVFTVRQLQEYVAQFNLVAGFDRHKIGTTADSVSRALRELRKRGVLNYVVANHAKGLLMLVEISKQPAQTEITQQ